MCLCHEGPITSDRDQQLPAGATDIHHLDAMVLDGSHPLKREQLAAELGLDEDWDFDNLFELICAGRQTAEDIDQLIHKGLE